MNYLYFFRASDLAEKLHLPLVVCNKTKNILGQIKKIDVIGDVKNKTCVIVDDIVDTGATLCKVAEKLRNAGCDAVAAYVTHAILSNNAEKNISNSCINEIVLSDSLAIEANLSKKFRVMPVGSLIVESISGIL